MTQNERIAHALRTLLASKLAFDERFETDISVHQACDLVREELLEIEDAVERRLPPEEIAAEIADAIVTILGVPRAAEIDISLLLPACAVVAEKNNRKTWDTHYRDPATGKITRK